MEAERRIDDVRRDLAEVEGAAREVPERTLATHGLVDRAQRLGRIGRVRGIELDEEDAVAPVHDLADALDRGLGEEGGDLHVPRSRTVGRSGRQRRLESLAQGGRGAGLVVIGGQHEARDGIEMRASRTPDTMPGGADALGSRAAGSGLGRGQRAPPGDDEGGDHRQDERARR